MDVPQRTRAIRAVVVGLVLMTAFVFFFLYPGHDPKPNDLPVGIVGPAAAAGALAAAGDFDVRRFDSPADARAAILDREIYGAFVGEGRLLVAGAASFQVAQLLREAGERSARGPLRVSDVRPLDRDDPRGTALNLVVLPLVLTAILASLVAFQLLPDVGTRGRVLLTLLSGLLGGLLITLIARVLIGALPGSFPALTGVAALGIIAVALPSGGLLRLLGPPGTGAPFLLFLMLGNPASGAAGAPELLPTPWAELGQFLPPGAVASALRDVAYFDGAALAQPLLVLLAWALIGLALHALAGRRGPAVGPQPGAAGRGAAGAAPA